MQPGNPQQQWNPPPDPSDPTGSGPIDSSWGAPAGGYGPPPGYAAPSDGPDQTGPGGTTVKRSRPGLIVLVAFLVELVLIGVFDNQPVVKHIVNFAISRRDKFIGQLAQASTVYSWRFNSVPGDTHHIALAQLGLVLTVFIVTALLVLAVVRGPVTLGRAFFGTWMAVVIATLIGAIVARLISGLQSLAGYNRFSEALFGGPNGFAFTAGLALGFVVALIAALVAVTTRRSAAVATDPSLVAGGPPAHEPTTQLPPPEEQTTQLPRFAENVKTEGPARQPPRRPDIDQPTVQFPRPPDDEDLGHHPDDN